LGHGGGRQVGDVNYGTPIPLMGLGLSNLQHYPEIEAAAAAGQSTGPQVAVKTFRSSKSGVAASILQKCANKELEALRRLQSFYPAVQLLAEGEPVTSPASNTPTAAGSFPSQSGSSKRKRRYGMDANALQLLAEKEPVTPTAAGTSPSQPGGSSR
jgi:hypothetical protein